MSQSTTARRSASRANDKALPQDNPPAIRPDPRAEHVAAIYLPGLPSGQRTFRLAFWTEAQWRALPAGEYEDMDITALSGFGKVSIEPCEDNWENVIQESQGRPALFPDVAKFRTLRLRHTTEAMAELVDAVSRFGVGNTIELLQRTQAERDATYEREVAIEDANEERKRQDHADDPVGFRVCEEDSDMYFICRKGVTLDDVIGQELEGIKRGPFRDRAIWEGSTLRAVIVHDEADQPKVIEFGGQPESAFDMLGIEMPPAKDVRLNAQPDPKRKAKGEAKPRGKRAVRKARA